MTVNEVAGLLGYSRDQVLNLITEGVKLPVSGAVAKLTATDLAGTIDVSDDQFDEFVAKFDAEEPGRWPPAAVPRELLIEARHACAICGALAPPQFHHMLDWAKVKHHDPKHMLALCGTCHTRCTNGQIDYKAQVEYKARLRERRGSSGPADPHVATKRAADLKRLKEIYAVFPRPFVARMLEDAARDRIEVFHLDVLDAENITRSTLFHLYDKELWKLLKTFFFHWNMVWGLGQYTHDAPDNTGVFTAMSELHPAFSYERHEQYHPHVAQAQHVLFLLNTYIRDQYPEFDLDESDKESTKKYWDFCKEIEEKTAGMRKGVEEWKAKRAKRAAATKGEATAAGEPEDPKE
jgi:hypothetical protein